MIELNVEFLEMCLWRIIKYSWWYLKVKLEIVLVIWVMKGLVWYFYFELLKCREINNSMFVNEIVLYRNGLI